LMRIKAPGAARGYQAEHVSRNHSLLRRRSLASQEISMAGGVDLKRSPVHFITI
jgi:hypothetical protein